MCKNIFFVLVFVIGLTSCNQIIEKVADNVVESSSTVSTDDFKTVSINETYQLDVPKYMKDMPTLHPEASLKYGNIFKEAYAVVIDENKQDFIEVFTDLDEYDSHLSPVENYLIVQKKIFDERIEALQTEDYELTKINDLPARQIKAFGNIDGMDISYVIAFVEGKDNIYMIMNWTIDDRFERLVSTFEHVNSTFKLLP